MTTPRQDWWLILRHGGVPHCWPVGDTTDEARIRDVIDRARALVGFPAGDGWIADPRLDVVLTNGQPHDKLMATATVHQLSDLDAVTADALAAYRLQGAAEQRRAYMQAAKAAMTVLTADERTQVISEIPPRTTTGGSRG